MHRPIGVCFKQSTGVETPPIVRPARASRHFVFCDDGQWARPGSYAATMHAAMAIEVT